MPQVSSNQRNKVLPAVQANGLPSRGSLSPGAWPTSMTLLVTTPQLTAGGCMFRQRRQAVSCVTCRASNKAVSEELVFTGNNQWTKHRELSGFPLENPE